MVQLGRLKRDIRLYLAECDTAARPAAAAGRPAPEAASAPSSAAAAAVGRPSRWGSGCTRGAGAEGPTAAAGSAPGGTSTAAAACGGGLAAAAAVEGVASWGAAAERGSRFDRGRRCPPGARQSWIKLEFRTN